MKGWRAAVVCAMALSCASAAHAGTPFSVRSGLFPPAPTLPAGSRNDNAEPGIAVDGAGAFYTAANINVANAQNDPRSAGEPGIDVWRSGDHGRTYRWVASPLNPVRFASGIGGFDGDNAPGRQPHPQGPHHSY